MATFFGDPGRELFTDQDLLSTASEDLKQKAKCFRSLAYFRLDSVQEAISAVKTRLDLRVGFEIGSEWYDPPDGEIQLSDYSERIISSHSVPFEIYLPEFDRFLFRNSWGGYWGHEGWGSVSSDYVNNRIVDSWCPTPFGYELPLSIRDGIAEVEWSWVPSIDITVHVREIRIDGERCAIATCLQRDGYLTVDELYVLPDFRGQGFGTALCNSIERLALVLQKPIRIHVSFADNESDGPRIVSRKLGLDLKPSPNRFSALVADRTQIQSASAWSYRPVKPATPLELLRPPSEPEIQCDRIYDVYFGTSRTLGRNRDGTIRFKNERGKELRVGVAKVFIPRTHKMGSLGSNFLRRWAAFKDDRLKVKSIEAMSLEQFGQVAGRCFGQGNTSKHLLFIHGYNTDFNSACLRAGQLGFDLKIEGHTFAYSWPSASKKRWYGYDEASVDASYPYFRQFMLQLEQQLANEPISIIAHSMGNRLLIRWLDEQRTSLQVRTVIFAAPDVDTERFIQTVDLLPRNCKALLYASMADIALGLSESIHGAPRAGLAPPVTVHELLETVLVKGFDLVNMGHDYFGSARPLLADLHLFIRYEAEAGRRVGLQQTTTLNGDSYWILNL